MSFASPLHLTKEQAARLLAYLQTYRRYELTQLVPSRERNQNQRLLQTLQGKLITEMDQPKPVHQLVLTHEEIQAMKTMAADLLVLIANDLTFEDRSVTLLDITELKTVLGKLYNQGSYTHTQP